MLSYKGYEITQAPNHHVWIAKDGKRVLHAQSSKPKTDDELREMVDAFIELTESNAFDVNKGE